MIVNKYTKGGGSGSGVTPEQVQEQINSALTPYWDSANTESAITAAVSGKADAKIMVDFDHTTQAERASVYADLYALYSGGSGATINKTYDFFKTVNTWQGLKIDYYGFSGDTLVFGKVVSPENLTDQVVYEQVMTIDSAGTVNVVTNTVGGGVSQEYVDSAVTILQNQLNEIDEVIPAAIVDLNERVDAISGSTPDLSPYWTSAQTEDAISAATSGKADAANITPNDGGLRFPLWNSQGVITGRASSNLYWQGYFSINDISNIVIKYGSDPMPTIYAPESAGTAGDILVSVGSGAPVWSAVTMGGVSQEYVDSAITQVQDQLDTIDQVAAAAFVDLNERVDEISAATPSIDLSGYYTSAQTEDAISAATSGKADAANITGRSTGYYFPYYNEQGVITGDTQAYKGTLTIHMSDATISSVNLFKDNNYGIPGIYVATKPGTAGQIAKSDGYGFTWTDDIYTPTSGFSTINGSAITNGGNIVISGGVSQEYVDSAITQVQDQLDLIDDVIPAAIVDLNEKKVESEDVKHMVKLTQAEYDQLLVKDPETFYIIVNSN